MRKILKNLLAVSARSIIKKYQPQVVGVTGSVGKSGAKVAIAAVLGSRFRVRASQKNYNTEIGLPLTVIGAAPPGNSPWRWLGVFLRAARMIFFHDANYPKILILEMAADRRGDIAHLVGIAPPNVAVLTAIGVSHAEFLGTIEDIAEEKGTILKALRPDGLAVLNTDDPQVAQKRWSSAARVITYGFGEEAQVRALAVAVNSAPQSEPEFPPVQGLTVKVAKDSAVVSVHLPGVLGRPAVYAALAAAAIGCHYGLNLTEIADALAGFTPPAGRLRLLAGIKHTLLIDDSYNASPQSVAAAVDALKTVSLSEERKRYVVLADMLELGAYAEDAHEQVGRLAAQSGVNVLITVGRLAAMTARAARAAGMSEEQVFHFDTPEEAGLFVQERLKQGDAVLVKGSRAMRLERVVKELMADPLRATELLVADPERAGK